MRTDKQYIRGSKRLQIIHKWLKGIDDLDYEVFPTKKEGRYIVKPKNKSSSQYRIKANNDINLEILHQLQQLNKQPNPNNYNDANNYNDPAQYPVYTKRASIFAEMM